MLHRASRMILLVTLLILSSAGERQMYRNDSQDIALLRLPLDRDRPDLKIVGQLQFLDAWELKSDNVDFGGISGLTLQPGGRFLAVGDAGTLIGFGLTGDDDADRPFIAPMPDAFGKDRNFSDRDAEAIVHDPASRKYWVSYEGAAAIRRFGAAFTRREAIARPKPMLKWGHNSGAEAMLRFPDGRFAVFSEGHDRPDGSYEALMFSGDPTEKGSDYFAFGYQPPARHKITDAKLLPDGRILTLNRKFDFTGLSATLAVLDPADIAQGETVSPTAIAVLESPLLVDNMEGLAIGQEDGRTIIWLISDNNFNAFQRSLLMKFALTPAATDDKTRPTKKPASDTAPGFDAI